MLKQLCCALAASALWVQAYAVPVPVDLSGWVQDNGPGGQPVANWTVQPGNDSVVQSVNSRTSVFYDPTATVSQGTNLAGTIRVNTGSDDDFVGFVLGYNAGEIAAPGAGFFLIDWKQGTQPSGGFTAQAGLALSHVSGTIANGELDYWGHGGAVNELARATNLGGTGWNDLQTYNFELIFTQNLIQVLVDNVLEISVTAASVGFSSFADGGFGFYNYSQGNVTYAGITQQDFCSIPANQNDPQCTGGPALPEPATLSLMALALAGLGWRSRRDGSRA